MPSEKKTLHYLGSTLLTAIAVGLLGFGMSTDWSTTKFDCSRLVNETNETGNAVLTLGLFNGALTLSICPYSEDGSPFEGKVLLLLLILVIFASLVFSPLSFLFVKLQVHLTADLRYQQRISVYTHTHTHKTTQSVAVVG